MMKDEIINKDTNVRSEEVSDIIERFPSGWPVIVTIVMSIVVMVTLILGFVLRYSDTVSGRLKITGEKAPVRIVANTTGRLHLLVRNNSHVVSGECIGYMENGATYSDIITLDSLCRVSLDKGLAIHLPDSLNLGSLGGCYNDFVLAYTRYEQLRNTKVYDNIRSSLNNKKCLAQSVAEGLKDKTCLYRIIHSNIERQYSGDSILHESGALSDEAFGQRYVTLISSQLACVEHVLAETAKLSEISGIEIELAKINLNIEEELQNAFNAVVAKRNVLSDELQQWKYHYFFISPIDGTLEFLDFWRENVFVNSGKEVFSVSPNENSMMGEMYLSVNGAGKVRNGQIVMVKLDDYPYDEYGYVQGKVHSISKLTHDIKTSEGAVKTYLVEIRFPDGILTNFGKRLVPNFETTGTGDIITKKRRFIERLFDNLKASIE